MKNHNYLRQAFEGHDLLALAKTMHEKNISFLELRDYLLLLIDTEIVDKNQSALRRKDETCCYIFSDYRHTSYISIRCLEQRLHLLNLPRWD